MPTESHVRAAELRLDPGTDPRAVGAAVTTELCGHWEHDGPCRWPHHNGIAPTDDGFALRVVFIAPAAEVREVEDRIDAALRAMVECTVVVSSSDVVRDDEVALAARLASG